MTGVVVEWCSTVQDCTYLQLRYAHVNVHFTTLAFKVEHGGQRAFFGGL